MAGQFDIGSPALQVKVYEEGRLIAQIECESAAAAAETVAQWEAQNGVKCEVEDLATRHDPEDILAPEPDDAWGDE